MYSLYLDVEQIALVKPSGSLRLSVPAEGRVLEEPRLCLGVLWAFQLSCCVCNQKEVFSCSYVITYMVKVLKGLKFPCMGRNNTTSFCVAIKLATSQFPGNESPHLKALGGLKPVVWLPFAAECWLLARWAERVLRAQKVLMRIVQPISKALAPLGLWETELMRPGGSESQQNCLSPSKLFSFDKSSFFFSKELFLQEMYRCH